MNWLYFICYSTILKKEIAVADDFLKIKNILTDWSK